MPLEIERKFLVASSSWKNSVARTIPLKQGYLSSAPERTVRVRVKGEQGILTIKGKGTGIVRPEFEYHIPKGEALSLLLLCEQPIIEKIRYELVFAGHLWEVDVFEGVNSGLVVAEIELGSVEESFEHPDWLGDEVSSDPRYFNAALVQNPYTEWESNH